MAKKTSSKTRGQSPPSRLDTKSMISADTVIAMLQHTSDWAFVLGRDGNLKKVEYQTDTDLPIRFNQWIGRSFFETVTIESKKKLESLLAHDELTPCRWRQLNHPLPDSADLPVRYCASSLDSENILLVGQSVRDLAEMQQRLLSAQQALESDFARMSQAKTRYQLLFDLSAEALLSVDADTLKIIDANPAAQRLLGSYIAPLKNNRFPSGFDEDSTTAIEQILRQTQLTGRADDVAVCTADKRASFLASATLLRDRLESTLMIRLSPIGESASDNIERSTIALFEAVVANSPDAIVICDFDGQIISANEAFVNMAQRPAVSSVAGKSLDNWLGRNSLDHRLLANNIKEHDTIPKFSTVIAGDHGMSTEVEISAAKIPVPRFPYMLLVIRNVQSRLPATTDEFRVPTPSSAPLKELVGRVPLKELVKESTDLIEKLCIESALEMTSDNRASAAEMLGVSRQSLYTKLRRFGLDSSMGQDQG